MVYCGKPSRGCQMCRTRRIKCDETKPTCQQCQKSRRQCPGYKDDFDIVFRNETKATERRARRGTSVRKPHTPIAQKDHRGALSSESDDEGSWDASNTVISPASDMRSNSSILSASLSVPVEDQAPCFFISNFIQLPRGSGASRGSFDFVLPIIKTEKPDSHVSIAFAAVALASLANRPNTRSSGLMVQAMSQYAKALKAINLALQNPALQKTDATLASIILMGLFETVTSEKTNIMAWGSHVQGAVQLTKLRGKKQLRTKTGYALFMAVRSQMLIHCMSASKAPLISTDWWIADGTINEPGVFVIRLCLQVAELRAEVNTILPGSPRNPDDFQKVRDIMKRAEAMEQEFKVWEESLPDNWRPITAAWVDNVPGGDLMKAEVFPGRVDIYEDLFISNAWNHARVSRQFVSGLIVRCAAWICYPVDYRTTPEYASATRLGVDLVTDVIASIPYHLGWRMGEDGALIPGDLSGFSSGRDDFTSPMALGGWLCTWCLFCATSTDYTTDSQRKWIKGRMNLIGEVMGLNQARVIGNFQIRLPSMVIRRDIMGHSPPTTQQYAQWAAMNAKPQDPPTYVPIPTATLAPKDPDSKVPRKLPPCSIDTYKQQPYVLSPLQQREAMKREAWEREKKLLLRKASNFGGESAEQIISGYLAI